MSALPFRHQFRPASSMQSDGLQGQGIPPWQEIADPKDGERQSWRGTVHGARRIDSSGTELYAPAFRIAVIAALALTLWAMVLVLWHIVATALH